MILNSSPANEATVSNVAEIGEFRIRNSAKAFSILSSGLYSNKIKAIIRELSTNARDSHIEAGKPDLPFDVHLPTHFEPWFNVRDYGVGLNHEQVVNIYTTYFESTKTSSNLFTGCLGLGSKSPFAYTDNFTVTAIKDGMKRIYTAFLNEQGVPSIALMETIETEESPGVQVQFSVEDSNDFYKFQHEAVNIFKYFTLVPVFNIELTIPEITYTDKNIVPGVHYVGCNRNAIAIMGNVAYPVEVPNPEINLGRLAPLLKQGLVMEFNIGELDFQPSREGLSYIPATIQAIKTKLEELQAQLSKSITKEADQISNLWERADFLMEKSSQDLWREAAIGYVRQKNFTLLRTPSHSSFILTINPYVFSTDTLSKKYNISIKCIQSYLSQTSVVKPDKNTTGVPPVVKETWSIPPKLTTIFVENDTNIGASERVKYHIRNTIKNPFSLFFILSPAKKSQPMDLKKFYKDISNPPHKRLVSSLLEKEKKKRTTGENVSILKLSKQSSSNWRRYSSYDYVWTDGGKAADFCPKTTHYYVPVSGYTPIMQNTVYTSAKDLYASMASCGLPSLANITLYGVRKSDLEFIKSQPNWINIETYIPKVLSTLSDSYITSVALAQTNMDSYLKRAAEIITHIPSNDSLFKTMLSDINAVPDRSSFAPLKKLCKAFLKTPDILTKIENQISEIKKLDETYPLLRWVTNTYAPSNEIAEYIMLVDNTNSAK